MMDERLKHEFAQLRAHERTHTPSFNAVLARAPRKSRRARAWLAAGAVAAAVMAALLLWPRHIRDDVATPSITQWHAPTDVLLNTPGRNLLSELPVLSESVLNLTGSP